MDIMLSNVSCVGAEHSLLECVGNTTFTACESLEDAAIICQGSVYVHKHHCVHTLMQAQIHLKPAVWMVILHLLMVLAH